MNRLVELANNVVDYHYMQCPSCNSVADAEHCICEFISEHLDSAINEMANYLNQKKA